MSDDAESRELMAAMISKPHEIRDRLCLRRSGHLLINRHWLLSRESTDMKEFLKTTVVGGVLFLLPVALVLAVLSHAFRLAIKLAQPISHSLHIDQIGKFA